jgi:hypothetical protein
MGTSRIIIIEDLKYLKIYGGEKFDIFGPQEFFRNSADIFGFL